MINIHSTLLNETDEMCIIYPTGLPYSQFLQNRRRPLNPSLLIFCACPSSPEAKIWKELQNCNESTLTNENNEAEKRLFCYRDKVEVVIIVGN